MSPAETTQYTFARAPLSAGDVHLALHGGVLGAPSGHQRLIGRVSFLGDKPSVVSVENSVLGGADLAAPGERVGELARDLFTSIDGSFHVGDDAGALAIAIASFVGRGARDAHSQLVSVDRAHDVAVFAFAATAHVTRDHDAEIPVRGEITVDRAVRRIEGRIHGCVDGAQVIVSITANR